MGVVMLVATCYGVLQLAVLGWLTRSVRVGTLLLAVAVGVYGCATVAVLLELIYTRGLAILSGASVGTVARTAGYTVAPFAEEAVKVLPLILAPVLLRRCRVQWGLTDYVLLGGAIGAGFGLVEALLRYGGRTERAIPDPQGGWAVPLGLSPQHVPGLSEILGSWLPAPVSATTGVNPHLAWSAIAGFGIGLLLRAKSSRRWLGLVPLGLVGAQHAAYNFSLTDPAGGGPLLVRALVGLQGLLWLILLVLIGVAAGLDLRDLRRGRAIHPEVLLAGERPDRPSLAMLRFAAVCPPWTSLVAARFLLARRALLYAQARSDVTVEPLRRVVERMRRQLDTARDPDAWRQARHRLWPTPGDLRALSRRWQVWTWLALVAPSVLYLVIGTLPFLADVQSALGSGALFPIVAVLSVLGLGWLGWRSTVLARTLPATTHQPHGDPAARTVSRLAIGAGGMVAGAASILLWLAGETGSSRVVSNLDILDALSDAVLVTALLLATAALAFFPPPGLVPVAGTGITLLLDLAHDPTRNVPTRSIPTRVLLDRTKLYPVRTDKTTVDKTTVDQATVDTLMAGHTQWLTSVGTAGTQLSSSANLSGIDLAGRDLTQAHLAGANLTGARLAGANLTGANLASANLGGADLRDARLAKANLDGAYLGEVRLDRTDLSRATLVGAKLPGATLDGAVLRRTSLRHAELRGTSLRGVTLDRTTFDGTVLGPASPGTATGATGSVIADEPDRVLAWLRTSGAGDVNIFGG
jgi:uncharacterized protein YjbI with pentapeptide repeats/RsiW-degrading membrane proteinase PrsW (M82 family)